ncbi:hypothetical protein OSB04_un000457 [Centaurea solstitialis]|uniref:Jacalin-type lectin domain-containing protein n=1 Tax=Centaurea solstitialis TaxID=347529 RepID=A0AA38SHN5_9ASTR|nr:hypothetical protein OSB04_un000457 [Centaurea solstitialis]
MGDKINFEGCISHGPWGGSAGKSWIYKPNGFIKKITIVHDNFIEGIKFYSTETESSHIGGKRGDNTDEIFINYPDEYLTSISGTYDKSLGFFSLRSLCFGTNHNHYGPYGGNLDGTPFSFEGEGVKIVGFHGHVSKCVTGIGIYVMPESFPTGLNSTSADNSMHEMRSRMSIPRDAGPWGGSVGGKPWDDGVFSTIKEVRVHVGEYPNVIHAIQFVYVESNAKTVLSPMHGGTTGDKMELVNLDGTDEYLIGISGFYGDVNGAEAITSITFHTNKKIHGPFGEKNSLGCTDHFTSTASPGKIGDGKTNCDECITHGPWGDSNGKSWIYKPSGFIRKITIVYESCIDGIKFYSGGSSTGETESSHFGDKEGNKTDEICIDYPNEYLTSISGTIGGGTVLSLSFSTNQNQYGPFGNGIDSRFSYEGDEGFMIVGFHGRSSGMYLNAIGIYVMPRSFALGLNSTSADNSMHEMCSRMSIPREAGPWGTSMVGKPWDDGVFSTIKEVRVHVGESPNVIHAIQFEYVESNAKTVLSPMHGGTSGDKMELVNLDGTNEYLTGISGFYGPVEGYNGLKAITSITLYTNKRIHGPFGGKSGVGCTYFASTASPGKIVGFHGWNDCFLTAIGVHMKYF